MRFSFALFLALLSISTSQAGGRPTAAFTTKNQVLRLEGWRDDLVHFEWSARAVAPPKDSEIYVSPMVGKRDYPGPSRWVVNPNSVETAEMRVTILVNGDQICLN